MDGREDGEGLGLYLRVRGDLGEKSEGMAVIGMGSMGSD